MKEENTMSKTTDMVIDRQNRWNEINSEMNFWRKGFVAFPSSYIEYHEELAREALENLRLTHMIRVVEIKLERDGWMDGMKVLKVIIETRSGKLEKIIWRDSHSKGNFMMKQESGGQVMINDWE